MNIRNFCIIAHIDHGKSTLADRLLEITATIDKRKMQAQYLDQMELERERGITIKMAPVRMNYVYNETPYELNLIDTPGHSDFSYEVSRALEAVEGAVLLVDATQGIQAQTLANFRAAEKSGLVIVGALNKVDLNPPDMDKVMKEMCDLLNCREENIHKISGKTGLGVAALLNDIIEKIPPPADRQQNHSRALIFDSFYDNHKGIIASVRVVNGSFSGDQEIYMAATDTECRIKELGIFTPQLKPVPSLSSGEIGYIATGVKNPEYVKIGDTVIGARKKNIGDIKAEILAGYKEPKPVVFVSFYPADADEHDNLKTALQKLRLNDSSLVLDTDQNEVLGRGFKVGFLGKLHFEITAERLKREFNIPIVTTFPSVAYKIKNKNEWSVIVSPEDLKNSPDEIWEPMVSLEVILPVDDLNNFFSVQQKFRLENINTETLNNRAIIRADMPLSELMSDFDDNLKSMSRGFASFSYELLDYKKSDIVKVDILIVGDAIPGLSRFLHKSVFEKESRRMLERLKDLLPRVQFAQSLQARADGKIIAREDIPALRKDVTGYLYGGDRTRKMKLWKKQKKGKERLQKRAHVSVSPEIFRELLKK